MELRGRWPFEFMVYRSDRSRSPLLGWKFKVTARVPDRETGRVDWFSQDLTIDFRSGKLTREKVAQALREQLVAQFEHEVTELLAVDGRLAFPSPHAGAPRKAKGKGKLRRAKLGGDVATGRPVP